MRRGMTLAAVIAAAAWMSAAGSMMTLAAEGWAAEGNQWFYYNRDGDRVENMWKKSGNYWYWLDGELGGAMAADKLIEDDGDTYYVDESGKMVTNTWVKIENESQDDLENPALYDYYYMLNNGKAFKSNGGKIRFKTIEGQKFAFDEEGKMLYGWVDGQGNRLEGESDWAESTEMYYLGDWNDGAMTVEWRKINVYDEKEGDDRSHWFYFGKNGRKVYRSENSDAYYVEKKINGATYAFDERGVMVYEWTQATGSEADISNWRYFKTPEDGARMTRGWFKTMAPGEENTFATPADADFGGADDGAEKWYYADGKGKLYTSAIKKVGSKYYGFSESGYMLSGLIFMSVNEDGEIMEVYDEEVDSDELYNFIHGVYDDSDGDASLYYFDKESGEMKMGAAVLKVDGESFEFFFSKTNSAGYKGKGVTGIRDKKYIYKFGIKMKADKDDKYAVYYVGDGLSITSKLPGGGVWELTRTDLMTEAAESTTVNQNGETVTYTGALPDEFYLIDKSGVIIQDRTAALDGYDWYFYVKDREIRLYANNKKLDGAKDENGALLSSWKTEKIVSY